MRRTNRPRWSTALCLFAFSAAFSLMVIHSLVNGSFRWSNRRGSGESTIVTPETHPLFYWGWLGFWTLIIIWFVFLGWKELQALRAPGDPWKRPLQSPGADTSLPRRQSPPKRPKIKRRKIRGIPRSKPRRPNPR